MYQYIHRTADWNEILMLRSSAEFGSIVVATQSAEGMERLRHAVIQSRASLPRDLHVTTLSQALLTSEVVASKLSWKPRDVL